MAAQSDSGVVLLCTDDPITRIVYHAVAGRFGPISVIVEDRVSRATFLKRRYKKLGGLTVVGQVLLMALVVPALRRRSVARIEQIIADAGLVADEIPASQITRVPSVNSDKARAHLAELEPRVVLVNGTRIIGARTLDCVEAPFINTHHGITPLYRGVHGGYWALAEQRSDLVGTTIHYIDTGIDTGGILKQSRFEVAGADNFVTYPYLHIAAAIPDLLGVVERLLSDEEPIPAQEPQLPSKLRTHPTIWEYLGHALRHGVK